MILLLGSPYSSQIILSCVYKELQNNLISCNGWISLKIYYFPIFPSDWMNQVPLLCLKIIVLQLAVQQNLDTIFSLMQALTNRWSRLTSERTKDLCLVSFFPWPSHWVNPEWIQRYGCRSVLMKVGFVVVLTYVSDAWFLFCSTSRCNRMCINLILNGFEYIRQVRDRSRLGFIRLCIWLGILKYE